MFRPTNTLFLLPLAILATVACTWAQDDHLVSAAAPIELPPVVVSGTRLTDPPFEQPYAFYRTTTEELDLQVGRTALDRFNYGPGVIIQRTAPNQASPFIRGLTGEQTLLMLDGVRFNHAFMRPGPNQYAALIPGVSINSIDAILGSSSTVNGSDGLTGALDFRLQEAGRGVSSLASPWAEFRADTGDGITVNLGLDGVSEDWAYSIEFSGSSFHDRVGGKDHDEHLFGPNQGDTNQIPNTGYEEFSAGLRLAYFGLADHVVELNAGHSRQVDAPRPGGYFENSGKPDRLFRFFDPQQFTYVHLRDQWQIGSPAVERLQTTLWWHQFAEEQFRSSIRDLGSADERVRRREFDDTLNAFGIDVQATTLLGGNDQHELTWGATYIYETTSNSYREFRTPKGSTNPDRLAAFEPQDWPNNTSVPDDSKYTTLGLFLQDDWQITEDISVLAGVRYSRYSWSFGEVDGSVDNFTGSLRGSWFVADDHNLFVGFSRGFRAPNLTNLAGAVDRGSSGNPAAGNPNLEPEISYTYEVGWKWQQERNYFSLSAFKTDIEDLIQRDFSNTGEFTNVEGADLYGFEAAWDYGIYLAPEHRLSLVGSVSLVEATRDIPQAELNNTNMTFRTDFNDLVPSGGFTFGIVKDQVAAFIRALESVTDTTVIANPNVLALNRQIGEVIVGRRDGYVTTTFTDTIASQSVEFLETGTQLTFRPYICGHDLIRMDIHPEDSSGGLNDANLPFKATTEVTTSIMVRDGHTILIGGLFREVSTAARSQVPLAGNIPLAGALFRNTNDFT